MTEEKRKVQWDKPVPPGQAMDVFRDEVRRQVELGIDIVRQVLDTDGLFSEDPQYPGVTRTWLEELTKTLAAERDKLEANEATIAVIGTMKAGKSTVINALVGSEVVPSRDQPMTTFPTRVIHAPGKSVPELTFPLSRGFDALVRAIRKQDEAAANRGKDLREGMMGQAAAGDLVGLLDQIRLDKVRFPARAKGHDRIQEVLGRTNDLTRLAVNLGVDPSVATPERLSFSDIPSIEVEFEHLATLKDSAGGRFSMVDTPGPNEAGKNERLREIVRLQLAEASGIILVLNYNELGAVAMEDLVATLKEIPIAQLDQLTILANRYDQRGSNSASEEQVSRFACEEVRKAVSEGLDDRAKRIVATALETLSDRVYPTSARFALRAYQAQRALRLATRIDPEKDGWALEFANAGFGAIWRRRPEKLLNPEELADAIAEVWQESGFERALERTIKASAANATIILMISALGKLYERSEPLLDMLNVRDSAFLRSLAELEQLTDGLQSDLQNLDSCLEEALLTLDSVEDEIAPQIEQEIETLMSELRRATDKFLTTGEIKVPRRKIELFGWFKKKPAKARNRSDIAFEKYDVVHTHDYSALGSAGKHGKVICHSEKASRELSQQITAEIESLFRHFINNGGHIIDQATELYIERVQQDVASLFGKEWQSVQDRLQDLLGLEISAPKPLSELDPDGPLFERGSYAHRRSWTETRWENVEGMWIERAASRFMRWWDGRDRNWGRVEKTISHNEYSVDVELIRKTSLELADKMAERMNDYLDDMLDQLREHTKRYADDVQTRVKSINTYILEEIRRGSDQSEASQQRRKVTSRLAAQARDLIAEAVAIRKVVQETRNG